MENLIFCLNATVPIFLTMMAGLFFRKLDYLMKVYNKDESVCI